MSSYGQRSSGSKTAVAFVGTGPAGATIAGGPVTQTTEVHAEQESTVTDHQIKGKVLLKGNVVKSVVSHEINNTSSLVFKGKIAASKPKMAEVVENPSKKQAGGVLADLTVNHEVKMCVVSVTMTTNGICFEEDDD